MDNINGKIEHFGFWSISAKFAKYITEHGITTNQSEGFNWLLHDLQQWKEAPIDCVILSFKLLQSYFLNEIRRGKTGLGTYTLRSDFSELMLELSSFSSLSCHPNDIVKSIREKKILLQQHEVQSDEECADNSRILRAQEIRQKDGISLSSKLGVFTVYDDRNYFFVKLFPSCCSCPLKEGCVHILAVQMTLNMPTDQTGIKNLTTVRKNARGTKRAKPGRKKPRAGDDIGPMEQTEAGEAEHGTAEQTQPQLLEQAKPGTGTAEHPEQTQNAEQTQTGVEQIVNTSDLNTSFIRDVNYSQEVWIPADGEILKENLNVSDRDLVTNPFGWLNGTLIDASMNLINRQFPQLSGLQSCSLAVQCDFKRHKDPFIQIINRSPQNGGNHWLTVTNIGCVEGLNICDSAFDDMPELEAQVLSTLIDIEGDHLNLHMLDVFPQNNSYDCGLYAIANMVSLAYRKDPTAQRYDRRKLRSHLFGSLERRHFEPFPTLAVRKVKKPVKKVHKIPVHCVCKFPDTHTLYIICDGCDKDFHPACIGITDEEIKRSEQIFCSECRKRQ